MGVFRLCLAFCVVLSHGLNVPIPAARADVAVQTFYIVSGFYMGLVLTEKYHYFSSYFTNRLLRLYPAYFAVAAVTLAHSLARWAVGRSAADPGLLLHETHFAPLDLAAKAYVVGTNLLLWGQDVALFLKLTPDGHGFEFTSNFMATYPHVEKFLLVPQAWSLSIELGFYLLAPWLVRRSTRALVAILAVTLAARVALAAVGLSFDPWTYRFFPVEVGSFVLGVLLYRSLKWRRSSRAVQWIAWAGLIAATLLLSAVPDNWMTRVAFYAYCAWALPLAFQLSRTSRLDRYLGELSYPVYLVHLLVIGVALYSGWSGRSLALLIGVMVLGAAILIHELVQKPVDRYRATRVA
jgi:peptidoglycan/LPS O-acetylase OafA/YrhL